jgi:hypothetical protein
MDGRALPRARVTFRVAELAPPRSFTPEAVPATPIVLNLDSLSLALKLNQAAPRCVGHSFGPADHIHLGEDAFHM